MSELVIKNSEGDFHQVQNVVLQYIAEGKITQSAFVLYSFYRSLAGFTEIRCSYEYIRINCGLSKGSIAKSNKLLEAAGLIIINRFGANKSFEIELVPGSSLPRRQLKKIPREGSSNERSPNEQTVRVTNTEEKNCSSGEPINIDSKYKAKKNNTPPGQAEDYTQEEVEFINEFTDQWCKFNKTDRYRMNDFRKVKELDNIKLARKLIPVLWSLDDIDKWVKKSNHSLSVFVKEFLNGNLQAYYPKTRHYYLENNRV